MTEWKSQIQIKKGVYSLQFETTDFEKYKAMEKAALEIADKDNKERKKEGV